MHSVGSTYTDVTYELYNNTPRAVSVTYVVNSVDPLGYVVTYLEQKVDNEYKNTVQ